MSVSIHKLVDGPAVATRAAADFVAWAQSALSQKDLLHVSVTGGTVGILTLVKIAEHPLVQELDWARIHIWWGDERFVAANSPDRNSLQARDALLGKINIPEGNIHEFPSLQDKGASAQQQLSEAARAFDKVIDGFVAEPGTQLAFDLTFLGMGPDGHIASLFPERELPAGGVRVLAEADSPKPPPMRLTFTYEAICNSKLIWFVVAGADKADAVSVALSDDPTRLPVGRVAGLDQTVWYLDEAAASKIS